MNVNLTKFEAFLVYKQLNNYAQKKGRSYELYRLYEFGQDVNIEGLQKLMSTAAKTELAEDKKELEEEINSEQEFEISDKVFKFVRKTLPFTSGWSGNPYGLVKIFDQFGVEFQEEKNEKPNED